MNLKNAYNEMTSVSGLERTGVKVLNKMLGEDKGTLLDRESRDFQNKLWETYDTFQESAVYDEYGNVVNDGALYNESEIDAIRHYYGTKLISENYGIPAAAFASTGHEISFFFQENSMPETSADLYNNLLAMYETGKGIGYTGSDFYDLIQSDELYENKDQFIAMADHALEKTQQAAPEDSYMKLLQDPTDPEGWIADNVPVIGTREGFKNVLGYTVNDLKDDFRDLEIKGTKKLIEKSYETFPSLFDETTLFGEKVPLTRERFSRDLENWEKHVRKDPKER